MPDFGGYRRWTEEDWARLRRKGQLAAAWERYYRQPRFQFGASKLAQKVGERVSRGKFPEELGLG